MSTLKINRLRTGIILSFLLLIGTFFVVKAMDKKEVVKVESKLFAVQWFEYSGPAMGDPNYDPLNPENYTAKGSTAPTCGGSQEVCGVHTDGQPSAINPSLTVPKSSDLAALQDNIENQDPIPGTLVFRN